MSVKKTKSDIKPDVDVQAFARSLAADCAGMATAISECARARVSSCADLRDKASAIFNVALHSSPSACKVLAVFSRRLHDRYPRFNIENVGKVTLGSAMFKLCQAELALLHEGVQASLDESSMENIPVDVNSLRQPQGMAVDIGANMRTPQSKPEEVGCPPPSSMLRRLDALQIFCACLYTQDLVPEDFIHKILDSHRFSSLSWPGPARHVGLMSACDMMMFCGKRLEKLGSLCHVMPDWYSYLRSLQQDLSIPRAVHDRIATVVGLRENGWISETSVSA